MEERSEATWIQNSKREPNRLLTKTKIDLKLKKKLNTLKY
jgi:hypothetical protein